MRSKRNTIRLEHLHIGHTAPTVSTKAAFLQPAKIHLRTSFHLSEGSRKNYKSLCDRDVSKSFRLHPRLSRMQAGDESSEKATESFRKLASDIREYLKVCPPSEPSPLAYITLRNAGRLDLISRIMDAGGYIQVSKLFGVRVSEKQFIPPQTSAFSHEPSTDTSNDYNSSLALGRDLEERLNTIEDVMKIDGSLVNSARTPDAFSVTDDVPTGEELRIQNETIRPVVVDEPIPVGERFTLTPGMQLGTLTLVITAAVGFGRSSHGVLSDNVISTCRSLSYVLFFVHVVLSVYAGVILAPQKRRNRLLWFVKIFLAGLPGIRYLRGLDEIPG